MTRSERDDEPGAWHHVMNRGIAKRTLFENDLDMRTFLSRLALAVRARLVEVHAYCLLTTHFHLLLRSPEAQLSEALHFVENSYSRWFNRSRKRDGPLYRGRFRSKRVDSIEYRLHLVRYIDENPVLAGLVEVPSAYPHASAHFYVQSRGPIWLSREWVESEVMRLTRLGGYQPDDYTKRFGGPLPGGTRRLVEKRIELQGVALDPLDDLIGAAPVHVLEWMRRKAQLADGTEIGLPVCDSVDVGEIVATARSREGEWRLGGAGPAQTGWCVAEVALLRELCGATFAEAGRQTGTTVNGAWRRYARHRRELEDDPDYAARVAELAASAMERCHGLGRGLRAG